MLTGGNPVETDEAPSVESKFPANDTSALANNVCHANDDVGSPPLAQRSDHDESSAKNPSGSEPSALPSTAIGGSCPFPSLCRIILMHPTSQKQNESPVVIPSEECPRAPAMAATEEATSEEYESADQSAHDDDEEPCEPHPSPVEVHHPAKQDITVFEKVFGDIRLEDQLSRDNAVVDDNVVVDTAATGNGEGDLPSETHEQERKRRPARNEEHNRSRRKGNRKSDARRNDDSGMGRQSAAAAAEVTQLICIDGDRRLKAPQQRRKHSSILSDIKHNYGVNIAESETENGNLELVITANRKEAVRRAADDILMYLSIPDRISIPTSIATTVIGMKSNLLRDIESKFGCRLVVSSPSRVICLYCASVDVSRRVSQTIQKLFVDIRSFSVQTVHIPPELYPWLRGPFNRNIDEIQRRFEVDIKMPPHDSTNHEIAVCGTQEAIQAAIGVMERSVEEQRKGLTRASFDLPKSQQQVLRSNNKALLQKVFEDTNVFVELPDNRSSSAIVLTASNNSAIGDALTLINQMTTSNKTEKIELPIVVRQLMRSRLPEIRRNEPRLQFELRSSSLILKGLPHLVQRTKEHIEKILVKMMGQTVKVCLPVSPSRLDAIRSNFKRTARDVMRRYSVSISLNEDNNEILLEGASENVTTARDKLSDIMKPTVEGEVTRRKTIDRALHRKLIGSKGSTINEMRHRFNVNINVPGKSENSDDVFVSGSLENVEQCLQYLQEFVDDLSRGDQVEDISVPKHLHRLIIGQRGVNINDLRRRTGVLIDIPAPNEQSETIILQGTHREITAAKEIISSIIADRVEHELRLSPLVYRFIRQNKVLPILRKKYPGVVVDQYSRSLMLRGLSKDVDQMLSELNEETARIERDYTMKSVELTAAQRAYILSNCHEFMVELTQKHDVSIMRSRDGAESNEMRKMDFYGKFADVDKAIDDFERHLHSIGELIEVQVPVPLSYHDRFLRRGEDLLRKIKQDFNVDILMAPNNPVFVVTGMQSSVEDAKLKIEDYLHSWSNELSVKVPCEFVDYLKRNMNDIVHRIEAEAGVRIEIPSLKYDDTDSAMAADSDFVIVRGSEANCRMAKELLERSAPMEKHLDIPHEYHARIIGRGGAGIQNIRRQSRIAEIIIPDRNQLSAPIVMRGTPESIEIATQMIKECINRTSVLSSSETTVSVNVPVHLHSVIVGRQGRTINQLRNRYRVSVMVPERGSHDECIVIKGQRDACEQARNDIESLVQNSDNQPRGSRLPNNGPRVTKKAVVDPRSVPRLIGARGRTINQFRDHYNVEVKFSVDDANPDVVMVSGASAEIVDEAVEALVQMSLEEPSADSGNAGRRMNNAQSPPDTMDLNEFPVF